MSSVLVRGLSEETVDRLKKRAASRNRSLQAELKVILEDASKQPDLLTMRELAKKIRDLNTNVNQTDSAILVREDRDR